MSFTVHPHRLQHFGVEAFPRRCRTTSAPLRGRREGRPLSWAPSADAVAGKGAR